MGQIALATLLVIGFGLHNATEDFGVVAPLTATPDGARPSWVLLATLGLIGGSPTFLGAVVGHGVTTEAASIAFLTLAAGYILYVITQLVAVAERAKLAVGLLGGMLIGFAADAVVTAAGV